MPIISTQVVEYKISNVLFDLEQGHIVVKVSKGYQDGVNFIKLTEQEIVINQTDTAVLFTTTADGTKTLYDNVKSTLYTYLINSGTIVGTIQ